MPVRRPPASADHAIRERAYFLWEQDGRPHGRDIEYWTRAQAEAAPRPKRPRAAPTGKPAARKKA